MTTPLYALLFFVAWTLSILMGVAYFRVSSVLRKEARASSFPGGVAPGNDLYSRFIRAHLNCVENLPLFGAVVLVGHVAQVESTLFSGISVAYIAARVGQTLAHLWSARELAVNIRFGFFCLQVGFLFAMILTILAA